MEGGETMEVNGRWGERDHGGEWGDWCGGTMEGNGGVEGGRDHGGE